MNHHMRLTLATIVASIFAAPAAWSQCEPTETQVIINPSTGACFYAAMDDGVLVLGYNHDISTGLVVIHEQQSDGSWGEVAAFAGAGQQDGFYHVDVDGDWAVIGAHQRFAGGPGRGVVLHRFGDGWDVITELTASDGEAGDAFGKAVGICAESETVIIGAYRAAGGGVAYVFQRDHGGEDNWGEVKRLTGDDYPDAGDSFGISVAISGDRIIVGAKGDDTYQHIYLHGAAYVFERDHGGEDNWGQTAKLFADIPKRVEKFGHDVDIDGNTIIVGTEGSVTNDLLGYAYIFEGTTLVRAMKGHDTVPGDGFGPDVSLDGDLAVVSAHSGSNGHAEAAYVFERYALNEFNTSNWGEVAKLQTPDENNCCFGLPVATGDDCVVVSLLDTDPPGNAYVFAFPDTDRDGLRDCWEIDGMDMNGDGTIDLDLPALGADPMHKDLFVEVDMAEGTFEETFDQAFALVTQAFADAPVDNPDESTGISLHIIPDETNLQVDSPWVTENRWPIQFDALKNAHFGTRDENESENAAMIRAARKRAFRYCIVGKEIDDDVLGRAEYPGNDIILMPDEYSKYDFRDIAGLFMHELGHNLNLDHGGGDDINGKPNYVSVMNYVFSEPYRFSEEFWRADYSRIVMDPLDENNLDENVGISGDGEGIYTGYFAPYGVTVSEERVIRVAPIDGTPVDWNGNDGRSDRGVVQDLNYLGNDAPFDEMASPSPGQFLECHDDWANLVLPIGTDGSFADNVHAHLPENEPTQALRDWVNATIPPPGGGAVATLSDLDMLDGFVVAGGIAQMQTSDNEYFEAEARVTGEAHQTHLLRFLLGADTDVENPQAMTITLESRISDIEGLTTLYLRDRNTQEMVQVDDFIVTITESVRETDIPDAAPFVRDADGRIELEFRQIVLLPFTLNGFHTLIDLLEIVVQ